MDPSLEALTLVAAGAGMGFINNVAGAGGLIGLAALDLAAGLGTGSAANATLRLAAMSTTLAGVFGFTSKGQRIPARAWLWGLSAAPGAALGALFVVTLPVFVYRAALIAVVATVLLQQFGGRLLRRSPANAAAPGEAATPGASPPPAPRGAVAGMALFSLVGLHMGFIQVAVGLLTMTVLPKVVGTKDLVTINAAKVAVLTVASTTSVACLAATGAVVWLPGLWLAAGAAIGSFAAGRWSVRRGSGAIRTVVLGVCIFVVLRLVFA